MERLNSAISSGELDKYLTLSATEMVYRFFKEGRMVEFTKGRA